ncbi:MAG TPA: alpha/beta fold hydrolase [Pseudobdellovibrionaceae bacterium]|nr:alpha/beta fold hydrolase [Pseudobdellovibrionaceae bacterium]
MAKKFRPRSLLLGVLSVIAFVLLLPWASGRLIVFAPGATPEIQQAVRNAGDLDQYLREVEARASERDGLAIRTDQAKAIRWAHAPGQVTELAIVYIHGFSASRLELEPGVSKLAQSLGANLYATRLRAHGMESGDAFAAVKAQDWVSDVREAVEIGRRIGQRLIVMGTSTGAPLAIFAAQENPDLLGVIIMSPNFGIQRRGGALLAGPLGPMMARLALGSHREWEAQNAEHARRWTTRYPSVGVVAMMDWVRWLETQDLREIQVPVFTLYSKRDRVVRVDLIEERAAEFTAAGSKVTEWARANRHELASATFNPELIEELVGLWRAWIAERLASATGRGDESEK